MMWGFFKKVVIADRVCLVVNQVFNHPREYAGFPLILACYFFAYQIYCDFSGYTDIARGAARCMGVDLIVNFRWPYCAGSIREFWHRWHISLSTWFRDYVYLPLGGSRCGMARNCFNLAVVFLVSGLWHGANFTFVAWGAFHAVLFIVYLLMDRAGCFAALRERLPAGLYSALCVLFTFNLVTLGWIFFRANSLSDVAYIVGNLFSPSLAPATGIGLSESQVALSVVSIIVLEGIQYVQRRKPMRPLLISLPLSVRWSLYYSAMLCVLLLGEFDSQQFIYFQF
jgi:D-alanyl-lipoteichoic acid acyltransferase DltB (MBOAT superfamily)